MVHFVLFVLNKLLRISSISCLSCLNIFYSCWQYCCTNNTNFTINF